jgi:hypothetical protein
MVVPKAAVHKDGDTSPWKHDIWCPGKITSVETKPQALGVERLAH